MQIYRNAIFGLCLLCAVGTLVSQAVSADPPPNIVFVLVDDMGYADLGCMGAEDIRTPNIDRLAREGVRFTDFYANAPICSPTRCGFLTGRWQQRIGFEWALGESAEELVLVDGSWKPATDSLHAVGLPATQPGIAKILKAAGYATGAFGKWHLGFGDEFNPVHHGFDEYFGELLGRCDYYRHADYDGTYALRDGLQAVQREGYLTDLLNERAVEFIRKNARRPFFLYVPHLAVHAPFQPPERPEPALTRQNLLQGSRADYRAMLERVDAGVGMILRELERHGLAENTLIVLSSDNGGERLADNSPLSDHKGTLWEGGIRVPCLMRWPAKLPRGKDISQLAITMDLTATFAAVAGASPPAGYRFDGLDLMPVLTGIREPVLDRTFFWRTDRSNRKVRAVRNGKWKYVDDGGSTDLLFDLTVDIGERRNLVSLHPDIVADLKMRLVAWEDEMAREPKTFMIH